MRSSVLLVAHPPKENLSVDYPLGVVYIASVLKKEGFRVTIRDYCCNKKPLSHAVKEIALLQPDFLGFSVYTFDYNAVKGMITKLRDKLPRTKIIVGGPHVSALPEFSLRDLNADFAVVGEAEWVTPEIMRRVESGNFDFSDLKGLAYRQGGALVFNPGCNIIPDLDALPLPAWDLLPPSGYPDAPGQIFSKRSAKASIVTSRGCPHACSFCASHLVYGRNFRKRSVNSVMEEIEFLKKNHNVKEINLYDATFTEDRNHAEQICKEMIRRKLDIVWRPSVGIRLDTLDAGLVQLFKESGCYELSFGLESLSDRVLDKARKPLTRNLVEEKIHLMKKNKISTFGFFIIGLPGETEDSIKKTIRFAGNSEVDYILFTQAVPLPGTEIAESFFHTADLSSLDWDNFYFYTSRPFPLAGIPAGRLKFLYFFSYFYCYLRWKRMLRILKDIVYYKKARFLKIIKFIVCILKNIR